MHGCHSVLTQLRCWRLLLSYDSAAGLDNYFHQLRLSIEHHIWMNIITPGWRSFDQTRFTHHPPELGYPDNSEASMLGYEVRAVTERNVIQWYISWLQWELGVSFSPAVNGRCKFSRICTSVKRSLFNEPESVLSLIIKLVELCVGSYHHARKMEVPTSGLGSISRL